MARFMVKASEFKNVCKAVNDRQFESLKKEIIEILKKQDEKEFKKAIDFFESQEFHYTHLEKSFTGKWIEKAGYGVGTVRIWKGKKYKKIAPGKWARVFEKEGRGTNIAIGKLIAKVQKIDNVEDLMAFVMANKQRFVDENGIDLPVLDKLRAAVDARNGNVGSKETKDEKAELKRNPYSIREMSRSLNFNELIPEYEKQKKILNWDINKKKKEIERNYDFSDFSEEKKNKFLEPKFIDLENQYQAASDNIEYIKNELKRAMERDGVNNVVEKMKKKGIYDEVMEISKPAEKKEDENKTYWIQDSRGNRLTNEDAKKKIIGQMKYLTELEDMAGKKLNNRTANDIRYYIDYLKDRLNPEDRKEIESEAEKYNDKDKENKSKKTVEETKETPKEEKTEKIDSVDNSGKVVSFDELQPIASNKSVGKNEAQLPYSKELADEIESLKNCVASKRDPRDFMKHVYYEDGKLVSTDARRMKFIEVGDLEGIPDGSYVDITTDKSGIKIKKMEFDGRFPNYSKVIPENLNQSATLDTKLVKDKIKEMQKDGAISKKGSNIVQLEFRDGKVFIDDTPVGEAKDIKMKYGENWGPANEETNFMAINADYLLNALSGKKSVLQIGERADKAVVINTGSSSNILMPMSGSDKKMDYGQGRKEKQEANDKKSALKAAYKKANEDFIASIKENYGERFKRLAQSAADNLTERMSDMSDETLKLNYDRLKFNLDKVMDKKEYITEDTKVDNKLKLGLRDAILYQTTAKEHPEVIERFEEELEKRGISVKKSLFDDFVMDMFIDEDEEEPEEENEHNSLFNDYSAEQPELFNSTEMKVQEAFNRCGCCL